MLKRVGIMSVDELLTAIPKDALRPKLGLPAGMSEIEVQTHLEALAAMNRPAGAGPFFIGGPLPRRHLPAAGAGPLLRPGVPPPVTPPSPPGGPGPPPGGFSIPAPR